MGADGKILGRGHNMRIQKNSATIHVCSSTVTNSNNTSVEHTLTTVLG